MELIKDNYEFGKQLRRKMMGYTIAAVYKKGITEDLLMKLSNEEE